MNTPCKICQKKRARRECPGIAGQICPVCCGTGRENTINCPSHCEFLQEARAHERRSPVAVDEVPHRDIRVTDEFVDEHVPLISWLSANLLKAMESGQAVDRDAGEALEAMIKTYVTLQSGLIYETQPANPYAAAIQRTLKESLDDLSKRVAKETGLHSLRDSDVLKCLVFLQRVHLQYNNGRPRGRAFFDFLRTSVPSESPVAI